MRSSNGLSLNQDEIESKAAELMIPTGEYRRLLAKKKLRESS